jgi:hypothetical protein
MLLDSILNLFSERLKVLFSSGDIEQSFDEYLQPARSFQQYPL